jgi:hypothetical protein
MNEIQNYSFICQTDKFISIKNRNDENKQDNNFFVFYYRCDSHDFTRFDWIIHDPRSDFMSILPQITYGNMALIFLSYFHG